MSNLHRIKVLSIAGGASILLAVAPAEATLIFPANQTPFSMPTGVSTQVTVCTFKTDRSKPKKQEFDITVDWGDGSPLDGPFHPANNAPFKRYEAKRAHTYASCGTFAVTCNVTDTKNGDTGSDDNTGTASGISPAPVMTLSAACPATGATGLTASVPPGATDYVWTMLDGNGADISSLITAGQNTESITFDAGAAGTLMRISLNETAADSCPAATSTRKAQVDYLDVGPSHPQHVDVCTLAGNQLTNGCGGGNYCPENPLTRAALAYLGLVAKHSADVSPYDPGTGTGVFADVSVSDPFVDWVEAATSGTESWMAACDVTPNFCPADVVTRAQMARFLLLAEHGAAYVPPPATGLIYTDVGATDFAADFIEQLKAEFTLVPASLGCGATEYCPAGAVTRAHLAHFLVNVFGIPAL